MCDNIVDEIDFDSFAKDRTGEVLLSDETQQLTQRMVWERAMRVGLWLHGQGIFNEPVGVVARHRADTLVLYLGVLASGNYYVPLQPEIRKERLNNICIQTGLSVILDSEENEQQVMSLDVPVRLVKETVAASASVAEENCRLLADCRARLPEDALMYLIFTSGSTGEPKGIKKTHRGMVHFLKAYIQEFDFDTDDRLANQTPFYFDASAKDIYMALKLKCRLYVIDEHMFVMPLKLAQFLEEEQITVIQWVPSALCMLSRFRVFDQVTLHYLKKVLFVGEVMPVNQLRIWMEALPETEFINLYGASEMAGVCMSWHVKALTQDTTSLPIGYPLPGCEVFLIQNGRVIQEPGETGEIYVRSKTLAAGYLGDEERTARVFTQRPCEELPEGIYYRSGDLAKYDEDGALVFVARDDDQIKHMGHRIELGEIGSALTGLSGVRGSCCIYAKEKIVLFYEGIPTKAQVRNYLKEKLVDYMIPNKIIQMEELPRNANGKADRQKLKDIFLQTGERHGRITRDPK